MNNFHQASKDLSFILGSISRMVVSALPTSMSWEDQQIYMWKNFINCSQYLRHNYKCHHGSLDSLTSNQWSESEKQRAHWLGVNPGYGSAVREARWKEALTNLRSISGCESESIKSP